MNGYSFPSDPCKLCFVFVLSLLLSVRILAAALGTYPSATTFSVVSYVDSYGLTSTINGYGAIAQTGSVLFPDTTNQNAPLASATLGTPALVFSPVLNTTVPSSLPPRGRGRQWGRDIH